MPPGADAVAQARALLNTLRVLASQHEQVLAAYERQLDVITAGGAAKLSRAPANKRPPPVPAEPEGPEAKKARVLAEQQQRRNTLWHECYKVLDRCRRNQRAEAFKKPVDPVRMKIPDYPLVVKNPMDLTTVGEKLKLRVYKDPAEFAADMRLIWDNAMLYNGRTHPVGVNAMAMSEFFEKAWGPLQLEKAWAVQMQQEELAREVRRRRRGLGHGRSRGARAGAASRRRAAGWMGGPRLSPRAARRRPRAAALTLHSCPLPPAAPAGQLGGAAQQRPAQAAQGQARHAGPLHRRQGLQRGPAAGRAGAVRAGARHEL
jgi:hypothetical protein